VEELEEVVRQFLAQRPGAGQSVVISLDGKTLRGTIPTGSNQGVHLLSAYMPAEGLVLMQVAVDRKENEISAAPRVLEALDVRGKVVVGDAMFTQRELSVQIVVGGGEYVWFVKDNQPETRSTIDLLFQEQDRVEDLQVVQRVNKAHGRMETRRLLSSRLLKGYLAWPYLEQVFKLERRAENSKGQLLHQKTVYGLTSMGRQQADAQTLLGYTRAYWGIENGLHYRRDKTFHEDATRMSNPRLAHSMAAINNLVLGLLSRQGWRTLPAARRFYDAHLQLALRLVLRAPT
jgi:predicted transposase YbfD/YdcC